MSESSSSISPDVTPERSYFHEHPLYRFYQYKADVARYELRNPEEETEYMSYLRHLDDESLLRQATSIVFMRQRDCPCLAHRLGFCLHNIPVEDIEYLSSRASRNFGSKISVFRSNFNPDVLHNFTALSELWTTPAQNYVRCNNCSMVLKMKTLDTVPKHTCHTSSATKSGKRSIFRYRLPFRTLKNEIITLDSAILPVKWTHIYLLDDEAAKAEELLRGKGIQANVVNVMLQDPDFIEMMDVLLYGLRVLGIDRSTTVYAIYLYLRFKLVPYLQTLDSEELRGKLNPVPAMIEIKSEQHSQSEEINTALSNISDSELESELTRIKNVDVNFYKHAAINDVIDSLYGDFTKDEASREKAIEVYKVLSRRRPISKLMKHVIDYYIAKGLAQPSGRLSSRMHYYAPDSNRYWQTVTNIFDVIVSPDMVHCPDVLLWLGIHERGREGDRVPFRDRFPDYSETSRLLSFN